MFFGAVGRLSEVAGPGELEKDFIARVFRHAEVSRAGYGKVLPKVRACIEERGPATDTSSVSSRGARRPVR